MPERILALDLALDLPQRFRVPDLTVLDPPVVGFGRGDLLDGLGAPLVPTWEPQQIPLRRLIPVLDGGPGTFIDRPPVVLVPDRSARVLWFSPTRLGLTDLALTVRREVRADGSVAVTGGSAVFSVSVYTDPPARSVLRDRSTWADLMAPAGLVFRAPVLPAPLADLTVALEVPDGVAAQPPIITVSPLAGAATVAVELTEAGTAAWRSALEQGVAASIPGTLRATASVATVDTDGWSPGVDTRTLDTPLGTLLAGRGAADVRQVDPQQSVAATVVVVGSQLVSTTTVTLRPPAGQAPTSAVIGPGGGRADITLVTRDPAAIAVEWSADVAFTPPRWPVVPASGRLDPASGWITMIKPEAWCVGYVLAVIPVDASGHPVPASTRAGDRVQGVLNFTAPYVAGGLLSSAFEAEYGRPTSLVLPRYPDRAFGDLVLTVFATCDGVLGQATRKLGETDVVVSALAYPDGRVELHTATESLPEAASGLAALLDRLGALTIG